MARDEFMICMEHEWSFISMSSANLNQHKDEKLSISKKIVQLVLAISEHRYNCVTSSHQLPPSDWGPITEQAIHLTLFCSVPESGKRKSITILTGTSDS